MWIRQTRELPTAPPHDGSELRLRAWVTAIAKPRHFWAEASENRRVGDAIATELSRLGFEVLLQGRYRNVVALPRARTGPVTLVAAHFDTVPASPGADDNASGVAVLLECARAMRDHAPRGTVGFVAFNAEE